MLHLTPFGGQGTKVYFIHGFGADSQSWVANVPAVTPFAEAIGVDLPAHGLSAGVDLRASLLQIAEQVGDSIDTSAPCMLVGHSAGGAIAMLCATLVPVKALALVSPAGLGGGINRSFLESLPMVNDEDQALALLQSMVVNKRLIARPVVARLLKHLQAAGIRERWQRLAALLSDAEESLEAARQQLQQLAVPVQVVWGSRDTINPFSDSLSQSLPGDWHQFDQCGHLPHIEQWSAYNKILTPHLQIGS